ncbi:sensor histidine kinase [Kitasatospora sp. MMS16-BH015]|uniref:sensor histidine kinase n=1 Tax=Kitasatospora sp. MMS16-BH015 TaxID=2018025 RepID=UPI000CF1DAB7|nr:ATP-binding protein [Kitasatospora sp. MMS16-BH015]
MASGTERRPSGPVGTGTVKDGQSPRSARARDEALREQGRLEERSRIARDTHDTVAQTLSALTLMIRAAEQALPAGADRARERLEVAYETALFGLGQAQDLIGGVAMTQLAEGGLVPALERYVDLAGRHLATLRQLRAERAEPGRCGPVPELTLRVAGPVRRPALPVASAALRVVQEAVTNAVRHAGAERIAVELELAADRVRVLVRDDGAGLAEPLGSEVGVGVGVGLAGMAQRVGRAGGRLRVEPAPGGGTVVAVEFPG